jgi:hypothetical protein
MGQLLLRSAARFGAARPEKLKRQRRERRTVAEPFKPFDIDIPVSDVPAPKTMAEQLCELSEPGPLPQPAEPAPEPPIVRRRERRQQRHSAGFHYPSDVIQHANHIREVYGEEKCNEFLRDYQQNAHHVPIVKGTTTTDAGVAMNTKTIELMLAEAKGKLDEIDREIAEARSREEQARADAEKKEQQKKEVQDFIASAEMTMENAKLIAPMFANGTQMLARAVTTPQAPPNGALKRYGVKFTLTSVAFPEMQKAENGMSCAEIVQFLSQKGYEMTTSQISQALSNMKANEKNLPFYTRGKLRGMRYYWRGSKAAD